MRKPKQISPSDRKEFMGEKRTGPGCVSNVNSPRWSSDVFCSVSRDQERGDAQTCCPPRNKKTHSSKYCSNEKFIHGIKKCSNSGWKVIPQSRLRFLAFTQSPPTLHTRRTENSNLKFCFIVQAPKRSHIFTFLLDLHDDPTWCFILILIAGWYSEGE